MLQWVHNFVYLLYMFDLLNMERTKKLPTFDHPSIFKAGSSCTQGCGTSIMSCKLIILNVKMNCASFKIRNRP